MDGRPGILIVGQTPPPFGGQCLMIEQLVKADLPRVRIYHVRMGFSQSMSSVGRLNAHKVLHLASVIRGALALRLRHRIDVLYYPPAGPTPTAVLRDLIVLAALRPFFRKVVFHFHAAGLSDFLSRLPKALRLMARAIYGRPRAAIQPSALARPDAEFLRARSLAIIPNGLADAALPCIGDLAARRRADTRVHVLFVGVISEMKGSLVLLEASRRLAARRSDFDVWFLGEFASPGHERKIREFCRIHGLEEVVTFLGMRIDDDKWQVFRDAHLLCLPSFLESFGNVLVEAMMFELPVVAAAVGGTPDIVEHGVTGFLLPDHEAAALAGALEKLIVDRDLRERMGREGRRRYLERFTLDTHLRRIEELLYAVGTS